MILPPGAFSPRQSAEAMMLTARRHVGDGARPRKGRDIFFFFFFFHAASYAHAVSHAPAPSDARTLALGEGYHALLML